MKKIAPDVKLGKNVSIQDFVNLYGCEIGDNTKIGPFVEIQKGAKIGKNCKIQSHTFICEGVTIEDNAFVGHNVTFINDLTPVQPQRAENSKQKQIGLSYQPGQEGASIGSSATLLCGITVGEKTQSSAQAAS